LSWLIRGVTKSSAASYWVAGDTTLRRRQLEVSATPQGRGESFRFIAPVNRNRHRRNAATGISESGADGRAGRLLKSPFSTPKGSFCDRQRFLCFARRSAR